MGVKMVQTKRVTPMDNRIENAGYVENMISMEGWKLFEKRVSELRDEAMYHVLTVDVDSVKWRQRLLVLDEILGIPQEFILVGKVAKTEDL